MIFLIAGVVAGAIVVIPALILAGYYFYKVKKGEEINPLMLIERVKHVTLCLVALVLVCALIVQHIGIGILISIVAALISIAVIHAIRTDVMAMEN